MMRVVFAILLVLMLIGVASAQIRSVYTKVSDRSCARLKPDQKNGELESFRCKGVGKYWINLVYGEDSGTAMLVMPSGKKVGTLLGYAGPNRVGETAEWRVRNGTPIGLIVRSDLFDPSIGKVSKSLLVVLKISRSEACIIDAVKGGKTQNAEARKLADSSSSKPCRPDNWFPEGF